MYSLFHLQCTWKLLKVCIVEIFPRIFIISDKISISSICDKYCVLTKNDNEKLTVIFLK